MELKAGQLFEIEGGPSKYDFLDSLSFRNDPARKVRLKIRLKPGMEAQDWEVQIGAIMQSGFDTVSREEHGWRFFAYPPWRVEGSSWVRLHFYLLGVYSTRTRLGRIKLVSSEQTAFFFAGFGSELEVTRKMSGKVRFPNLGVPISS